MKHVEKKELRTTLVNFNRIDIAAKITWTDGSDFTWDIPVNITHHGFGTDPRYHAMMKALLLQSEEAFWPLAIAEANQWLKEQKSSQWILFRQWLGKKIAGTV
jgi:hypothetical protein